ncbi:hypothetical protein EC960428_3482, partial [Escherichia coli 96.0428]
IIFKITTG